MTSIRAGKNLIIVKRNALPVFGNGSSRLELIDYERTRGHMTSEKQIEATSELDIILALRESSAQTQSNIKVLLK